MPYVVPIVSAIVFGIVLSTNDTWSDANLSYILYSNGQTNWGILILVPIFGNTLFTFCSMLYNRDFKNWTTKLLGVFFTIFVLLQFYPQMCIFENLFGLIRSKDMAQFTKRQAHLSGTLGTLEPFIESTPQLFIQTAFLAHTGLSLDTLKLESCTKQSCMDLESQLNECELMKDDLKVNEEDEIDEYVTDEFNKTTRNDSSTAIYENCTKTNNLLCEEDIENCLIQIGAHFTNQTLADLQLGKDGDWRTTSLHQVYGMERKDLDTVALYLILFGEEKWKFWVSYAISYFSAAIGITNYLKNCSRGAIDDWKQFAFVFIAVLLSLLWKVLYLYFLIRTSGLSEFLNIFFWILACFVPQFIYIITSMALKCPQSFSSLENMLMFKQPQIIMMSCISPVAFDAKTEKTEIFDIKTEQKENYSFGIFTISSRATYFSNAFQAIISLPFAIKLIAPMWSSFFSWYIPTWQWVWQWGSFFWPILVLLIILMIILAVLVLFLPFILYFLIFACFNMSLVWFMQTNKTKTECILCKETLCRKCHGKSGVVFPTPSQKEQDAQEQRVETIRRMFRRMFEYCFSSLGLGVSIFVGLSVLSAMCYWVYYSVAGKWVAYVKM